MFRKVGLAALSAMILSAPAFAAHNLLINGKVSDTIFTSELPTISFFTEAPGARANVRVYLDVNQNGQVEPGDPLVLRARMIDGDYSDSDQVANGFFSETGWGAVTCVGPLIVRVEDGGVAADARLLIQPEPTGNSVAGHVLRPPRRAGLMVLALDTLSGALSGAVGYGMTDTTGHYYVSIPDSPSGHDWMVYLLDGAAVAPGYVSLVSSFPVVHVNGHVDTINLAMDTADGFVIGQVRDDLGRPMPDSLLVINYVSTSPGADMEYAFCRTSGGGRYRIGVKRDSATYCALCPECDGLEPDFLIQSHGGDTVVAETLITLDLTVYHTDTTISGHIYKDGAPANRIALMAIGLWGYGWANSGSYADGYYAVRVSSQFSLYAVVVSPPPGYCVEESTQFVAPGDTGVNFHLVRLAVQERATPRAQTGTGVRLLPVACPARLPVEIRYQLPTGIPARLCIYDLSGRLVASQVAKSSGPQTFTWTGQDRIGHRVVCGIYFVMVQSPVGQTARQRILIMQ
jgi:hypothetical protein